MLVSSFLFHLIITDTVFSRIFLIVYAFIYYKNFVTFLSHPLHLIQSQNFGIIQLQHFQRTSCGILYAQWFSYSCLSSQKTFAELFSCCFESFLLLAEFFIFLKKFATSAAVR